jgi:hypothetical protein
VDSSNRLAAVAHGATIHSAIEYLRNRNRANILTERTSPANFFVKCRVGTGKVTLAMEVRLWQFPPLFFKKKKKEACYMPLA